VETDGTNPKECCENHPRHMLTEAVSARSKPLEKLSSAIFTLQSIYSFGFENTDAGQNRITVSDSIPDSISVHVKLGVFLC
jgi:hypothetical protein